MDQLNRTPPLAHVVVIATTNQIERVESSLRRPGRFDREVEISVPTASERKEVTFPHCDLGGSINEVLLMWCRFWGSSCKALSTVSAKRRLQGD